MSSHDIETGNDQNPAEQGLPSIHSQDTVEEQRVQSTKTTPQPPQPPTRSRSTRLIAIIAFTTIIVILLGISIGFLIYAQRGPQPTPVKPTPKPTATPVTPTPTPPPITGQWVAVYNDYKITSQAAAPSNSNVLYACAIAPGVPVEYQSVQTVLRSADFGTTWQDIGKRAQMSRGCELIINPTDSYEIYVATSSNPPANPAVPSYVLEHTSNGGDSWETIHPTVHVPSLNTALAWQGTQLRFAGNLLYSVQAVSTSLTPIPQEKQVLSRVLMSTDGGHTWNMLDTQLANSGRSAEAYVVNPAHPALFYELAYVPVVPGTGFPPLELYRSTDGGTTWQTLLQHITWMSPLAPATILMGSENANAVYLTNTRCPAAQALHAGGVSLVQPLAGSPYSVCMSSDAGKSWRTIPVPSQFAYTMGGGVIDQQGRLYTVTTTSGSATEIWRYDPISDMWSKVTNVPTDGSLMAVTPTSANGNVALWFLGTGQGKLVLYRYVEK
jgi:hypothetical protein